MEPDDSWAVRLVTTATGQQFATGHYCMQTRRFCDRRQGIVAHFGAELNWAHWTYDINGLAPVLNDPKLGNTSAKTADLLVC